jgi:hypothetical protein
MARSRGQEYGRNRYAIVEARKSFVPAEKPAAWIAHLHRPISSLSRTHIERFAFARVKGLMSRIRVMLGWLLSVLLLLATGYCFLESLSEHAGDRQVASVSATQPGTRFPIQGSCSFEQLARCWNRRVWIHSGPDGFPVFLAASDLALPSLLQADCPLTICEGPLGLAKSWQFHWRTALEPRAPSSVS